MSGNDIDNSSNNGPISVVVRQDGIGRTGALVLGAVAGLALGIGAASVGLMLYRDDGIREEMRKSQAEARNVQTEYRVMLNHTMELEASQKVMAAEIQELKHVKR